MRMQDIREGATVRSRDGEKLGKVIACQTNGFIIEKGLFFKKDYEARYDDVIELRDGDLILARSRDELPLVDENEMERRDLGSGMPADEGLGYASTTHRSGEFAPGEDLEHRASNRNAEDVSIPLTEEQLEIERRTQRAGEVRVTKDVVTENRTVNVPVQKEVARVETIQGSGQPATGKVFEKDEITVPIHEEEVEITKRPVVAKEVRVTKDVEQENKSFDEKVRREEAKVDTSGKVPRPRGENRPS